MYLLRNITLDQFNDELDKLFEREFNIDKKNRGNLSKTDNQVETWKEEIKTFLKDSITPDPAFFIELADKHDTSIFDSFRIRIQSNGDFDREIKTIEQKIALQKNNIKAIKEYVSICDSLNGSNSIVPSSAQEKLDFTLEKLNILASDKFHSVESILGINGVINRNGESVEMAILLNKKGYATKKEQYKDNDDYIKITVKGSAYIERKQKSTAKKSKDENLNAKIDEVLANLHKLGFGQEIIFEEIEEMREQIGKLSKKSWGQLLKGKLMDLAVSQVINKETAGDIFKFLTDSSLALLK